MKKRFLVIFLRNSCSFAQKKYAKSTKKLKIFLILRYLSVMITIWGLLLRRREKREEKRDE